MIVNLTLDREEFAAQRRKAQDEFIERLLPVATDAIERLRQGLEDWDADLLRAVRHLYETAYGDEGGEHVPREEPFIASLSKMLEKTTPDSSPEAIATALAIGTLNAASAQAAQDDPEELVMEWVTMHDKDVRTAHRMTDGQQRPLGEKFDVDGTPMLMPGDVSAPIELWINCRCTLRPVLATEAMSAQTVGYRDVPADERDRLKKEGKAMPDGSFPIANCEDLGNAVRAVGRAKDPEAAKRHIKKRASDLNCGDVIPEDWSITAAVQNSELEAENTSTVIVALPADSDPVNKIGDEQKHITLAYLGEQDDDSAIQEAVGTIAANIDPFVAGVAGFGTLGPEGAKVWFVEAEDIARLRVALLSDDDVAAMLAVADTHPHFIPHVTVTYDDAPPEITEVQQITFDRLAVWHRDQQTEYPLGDDMGPDETTETPADETPDEQQQDTQPEPTAAAIPWHGVLAPENVRSGDGRKFGKDSLRHRDLPLPLTWQKVSDDGHKGNVTVAKIEKIAKVDGEMRASGHFIMNPEADEVVGLLAEFGKFGVSVDADDATFEMDDEADEVVFTSARVSSACIVPIPAFAEAWVMLGDPAEDFLPADAEEAPDEEKVQVKDPGLTAALEQMRAVAMGRGPGWITNPEDTKRLHDYWTVPGQPGYEKVQWGVPGDFYRCRTEIGEEIGESSPEKLRFINQQCAQWHHDALGWWPGHPTSGETAPFASEKMGLKDTEAAEALSLTAAAGLPAPAEWFSNPGLSEITPLTVTEEGQVFGHLAEWGTCHIGFSDSCVTPPHSATSYAYFLTGERALDSGESVAVGQITIGGGHAGPRLGLKPTLAHYDSTSAVVADVTVGEDEHGIWFAGALRPGVSEEMVTALQASALSGDWRRVGGGMELVAALAVNVPGFPIPRTQVAASSQGQVSLVAAGIVQREDKPKVSEGIDVEALAIAVATQVEQRMLARQKMAALAARVKGSN